MRFLATTTLAAALFAFAACDATAPPVSPAASVTAQPAAYGSQEMPSLTLQSGLGITAFEKNVLLKAKGDVVELSGAEALLIGQALTYAAAEIVAPVAPMPKGWPPPVCDEPPPGAVSGGCPFAFAFSPKLWDALFDGRLPFADESPEAEPVYTFGFWHQPAQKSEAERLSFTSGLSVVSADERVFIQIPDGYAELSGGEALAIGQAMAFAGLDLLAPVMPIPKGWPPPVCDPPSAGAGGCPLSISAGPELWKEAFGGEGLPLAGLDPDAEATFAFGFWQRVER